MAYTRLKYIRSTGIESLNTQYTINDKSVIKLKAKIVNADVEFPVMEYPDYILNGGKKCYIAYYIIGGVKTYDINGQAELQALSPEQKNTYLIDVPYSQMGYIGDRADGLEVNISTGSILRLLGGRYSVEIYSLRIYEEDNLVADFIPALKDGLIGLYDLQRNVFDGKTTFEYEIYTIPKTSYEGKISGVGNVTSRKNEITADDLAILRNYHYNWEYGVINREGWNFNAYKEDNNVIVNKGIMFAYGYFGIFPESVTISFIKPSATQYRFIYAEIDRSVVPNTCTLKVKNNQGSDKIKPTTFRQDYLTAVRTGVFQLPLWIVKLDNSGIVEIKDVRNLQNYIKQVYRSNNTTGKISKYVSPNAIATTQAISDNSEKLATTEFVHLATRDYIDNN